MVDKKISTDKSIIGKTKRLGKRALLAHEVLQMTGQSPVENLIRLAKKAEKAEDFSTASGNWKTIQEYVEAKRKAVDPMEQHAKSKQAITIKELESLRDKLLENTEDAIIEVQALEIIDVQEVPVTKVKDLL